MPNQDAKAARGEEEGPTTSGQASPYARSWVDWAWSYLRGDPRAAEAKAEEDYARQLWCSLSEDFEDLDSLQLIQTGLRDLEGRPVAMILAKQLPAALIQDGKLYRFVISKLDSLVQGEYSILYIHTGASYFENSPGIRWLWATYGRLPARYRRNLHRVCVVHADLTLWASSWILCPWLHDGLWSKMRFLLRVEFLWDYVSKDSVVLPEYVLHHDNELEEQPLMDYGIVGSKEWQAQASAAYD
eukprot:evm.model.scf_1736.2 EVM.evm.TU.scf_1736.2   scf_1736:14202-19793(-)